MRIVIVIWLFVWFLVLFSCENKNPPIIRDSEWYKEFDRVFPDPMPPLPRRLEEEDDYYRDKNPFGGADGMYVPLHGGAMDLLL